MHQTKHTQMVGRIETYLKQQFPEATDAECRRFVSACRDQRNESSNKDDNYFEKKVQNDAEKLLKRYLDWRNMYRMDYNDTSKVDDDHDDAALWNYAVQKAFEIHKEQQQNPRSNHYPIDQFLFVHKYKVHGHDGDGLAIMDRYGYKILHVLPALIDKDNVSAEMYGMVLIFYLDQLFDRHSEEKMTVVLDVRPGSGWPNSPAVFMVNYVRRITRMLQGHFPERLQRLIIFPIPRAAVSIYNAIRWVIHANVVDKIVLIPGPADRDSPIPTDYLREYMDTSITELTETKRMERFRS